MNTLKKLKSLLVLTAVLLTSIVFTSCNSDDDKDASIVGTWLQVSGSSETLRNGESISEYTDVVDADNYSKITFNADGTFSELYSESYDGQVETSTDTGVYTISGNTISVTYDYENEEENEYDDNTVLTFEVSSTQLIVSYLEEYTNNDDEYVYKGSTTFVRE